MREGWEYKKLAEMISITHGYAFKGEDFETDFEGNNPIVLTPGNFSEESKLYFNRKNTKRCHGDYSINDLFKINELVVVMTDLSSKMKILGKPAIIDSANILHNQRIGRVIFKNEDLELRYLFHFFNSDNYLKSVKETATGTMVRHTSPQRILLNEIPIPPLEEQKQIVAILDQAFEAIDQAKANIEKNIANAKELFQSKLNAIFSQKNEGWEEKSLGEIGKVQTGTTPPTNDQSNYGGFIPFVKPAHFRKDGSIDTGESKLSKSGLEKGRLFDANSVLMVCIGATIGKTGFTNIPVSSNQQINALTPSKDYEPRLLYYALISPYVQNQVMEIGKSAQATLPIINKSKWEKLKVNITLDKNEQLSIINLLDNLNISSNEMKKIYTSKLEALEELKKSILQKAFTGELTNKEVAV